MSQMLVEVLVHLCVVLAQVGAVRLFFTPEEGHDPSSLAKRHFLQTGEDLLTLTGQLKYPLIFFYTTNRER